MRVLWFSVTPAGYSERSNAHNGGGWIAALESIVRGCGDIDLAVAFNVNKSSQLPFIKEKGYYLMPKTQKSLTQKLLSGKAKDGSRICQFLSVIDDFKPDIIQIFGSENEFGQICASTVIPTVIHMQGSLPPTCNAFYPAGINRWNYLTVPGLPWRRRLMGWLADKSYAQRAEKEIESIQSCSNFMGRTNWDHQLVSLINPSARYFHCEEALRPSFIDNAPQWQLPEADTKPLIVSVLSNPIYKGVDVVLKAAKLLKRFTTLDFEWRIYGVADIRFFEQKFGIKAEDVNVRVMGTVAAAELGTVLAKAACYVHTSYIDNSPNSICEAQYIGVPVIATNVGGISSLVEDGVSGLLYPSNGVYELAQMINGLLHDAEKMTMLSLSERTKAHKRHDANAIGRRVIEIYNIILGHESCC